MKRSTEDDEEQIKLTEDTAPEEILRTDDNKKKRRKMKKITEEDIAGPDGIRRIYEEFPSLCRFRGRGYEAHDLRRMIAMYKEWSFQLYPTFAFEDVISKVSTFGGKGVVRSEIEALRSQECSRYMRDVLGFVPNQTSPASPFNTTTEEFSANDSTPASHANTAAATNESEPRASEDREDVAQTLAADLGESSHRASPSSESLRATTRSAAMEFSENDQQLGDIQKSNEDDVANQDGDFVALSDGEWDE